MPSNIVFLLFLCYHFYTTFFSMPSISPAAVITTLDGIDRNEIIERDASRLNQIPIDNFSNDINVCSIDDKEKEDTTTTAAKDKSESMIWIDFLTPFKIFYNYFSSIRTKDLQEIMLINLIFYKIFFIHTRGCYLNLQKWLMLLMNIIFFNVAKNVPKDCPSGLENSKYYFGGIFYFCYLLFIWFLVLIHPSERAPAPIHHVHHLDIPYYYYYDDTFDKLHASAAAA